MRRTTPTTPTEMFVLLAVLTVGLSTATLLASYYPDSDGYIYVGVLTVALLFVAGFFIARARKKAT